jgi:SAM-dependent methyltransferase
MDPRLHAPATQRNRQPILDVLSRVLPGSGTVLEIASGTGEHAVWFAQQLRPLVWQTSDPDPEMRASIAAHGRDAAPASLPEPLDIDARAETWPLEAADAVVCINMIHIAPWEAALGLFAGAGRLLRPSAPLVLYGPYKRYGEHTASSNADFDASLRAQSPAWGVRDLESEVVPAAATAGLALDEVVEMPANNLTVVFRKAADSE